jgi:hypothetical protein
MWTGLSRSSRRAEQLPSAVCSGVLRQRDILDREVLPLNMVCAVRKRKNPSSSLHVVVATNHRNLALGRQLYSCLMYDLVQFPRHVLLPLPAKT